jgi:hypothetical protein
MTNMATSAMNKRASHAKVLLKRSRENSVPSRGAAGPPV